MSYKNDGLSSGVSEAVGEGDMHVAKIGHAAKRRSMADENRMDLLEVCLFEKDPALADMYEEEFVTKYIKPEVKALDDVVFKNRNDRYERLTPLRATDLLAETYYTHFEFGTHGLKAEGECEIGEGLEGVSLAAMRHLWRIRQDADLLGADYDDHVALLFKLHKARGNATPPMLKDMHGGSVMTEMLGYLLDEADADEASED